MATIAETIQESLNKYNISSEISDISNVEKDEVEFLLNLDSKATARSPYISIYQDKLSSEIFVISKTDETVRIPCKTLEEAQKEIEYILYFLHVEEIDNDKKIG